VLGSIVSEHIQSNQRLVGGKFVDCSRNNLEMRVALPLKLKGNHGCRHIRGKDFDELTINGVFKTRTAFGFRCFDMEEQRVNDETTSQDPRLSKQEDGR